MLHTLTHTGTLTCTSLCSGLHAAQVGLGTDCAGGYAPSIMSAMRTAVVASKALRMQTIAAHQAKLGDPAAVPEDADAGSLNWRDALWLATMGGAQALGIQARCFLYSDRVSAGRHKGCIQGCCQSVLLCLMSHTVLS